MTNPYGPWATSIDPGRNPRLSAFWRQRLTQLPAVSRSSPVLELPAVVALIATALLIGAVPTFYGKAASAEQTTVAVPEPTHVTKAVDNRALKALDKIRSASFTCTTTEVRDGSRTTTQVAKYKILCPGRWRVESDAGDVIQNANIQIGDAAKGRYLTLSPKEKRATVESLYPPVEIPMQFERDILAAMPATLTEKKVDGRKVAKFSARFQGHDCLVTLDSATWLPIRIEMHQKMRPAPGDNFEIVEVFHDFKYDAAMDGSLFATEPPPGYEVQRFTYDSATVPQARDDAQQLVISPKSGIGPVKFGMSRDEVVRLLGRPNGIERNEEKTTPPEVASVVETVEYNARGFQITVNGRQGVTSIRSFNRVERGPTVRDFVGKTAEGIRLGASWQEVTRTYGKPETVFHGSNDLATYGQQGWTFSFEEGRLCGIDVSPPSRDAKPAPASERLLAKFRHIYALPDSKVIKRVPPPFSPGRLEYYRVHEAGQAEVIPEGPEFMWFKWDEPKPNPATTNWDSSHEDSLGAAGMGWVGGKGVAVWSLINDFTGIERVEMLGDEKLLDAKTSGDWVIRDGISPEKMLRGLEAILRTECKLPIRFRLVQEDRKVIVAEGRYTFHPSPGIADKPDESLVPWVTIDLLEKDRGTFGEEGSGNLDGLFSAVGFFIDCPVINEVSRKGQDLVCLRWKARRGGESHKRGDADAAAILKHVSEQTGLTFSETTRRVRVLRVERAE